jgi:toxin CptA
MSIAVSAMVKPSRLLLMMVCTMCIGTVLAGSMLILGKIGGLTFPFRTSLGIFIVFLGFIGFCHTVRHQKNLHIDISGVGQFRLSKVDASVGSCQEKNWPHVKENGDVFRLLPDSTIWPHLLLLRLQADTGKITVIPVLPDCVSRDSFRALSVACRWIAAHNNPAEHKNL